MSLVETLRKDMFEARKSEDKSKSDILSMAIASIVNAKINKGEELSDLEQQEILRKETKKLTEAYELYLKGGRDDLAANEKAQLDILNAYLPQLMSEDEIRKIVVDEISKLAVPTQDLGKLMGLVMPKLKGKADGALVNKVIRETISNK